MIRRKGLLNILLLGKNKGKKGRGRQREHRRLDENQESGRIDKNCQKSEKHFVPW